ncbi:MAG TPA: hypothetical protein VGA73_11960 [Candidatus Binatia bacterium]
MSAVQPGRSTVFQRLNSVFSPPMNLVKPFARNELPALSLLVLMVLWFSHEMVWGGKIPFFRDLGTYFYPMRFSLAQSFNAGELPLWNRRVGMGYPLLANFQSGTFYPPHFIYFVFPFFPAIQATFLFHYLAAVTGAYALCRS